jgi:hemolysin activation/secretion protein
MRAITAAATVSTAIAIALASWNARAQDAVQAPDQAPGETPANQVRAPKPDPAFDILEIDVEGNSVLSTRQIERIVTPFLGPKRHFSDVEGARKALEDAYQKSGYQTVFVDIPEQRVTGGVIRLHVLEGKVGQLRVTGERYFEPGEIRKSVPELAGGSVPDFTEMQQELSHVNKFPDRQISPILTPGKTPGTVDVNLSVKDTLPLHGDIEDDNHASPFTVADRASASIHYDNLWQQEHSIALNYQVAPQKPSETNVLYATYLWRFAQSDDVISAYAIRSNSNVAVVGSSTILGNAKIAGVRWIMPLLAPPAPDYVYFHSVTLGLDRKDFAQTDVSAQTSSLTVLPPITYYPLSLMYSFTSLTSSGTSSASLGLVTAPRDVFGNTDAKFQSRRVLGGASFVEWKFEGALERSLSQHWGAYTHLVGQWTVDPLIPNEQFLTGGADTVRGYRESEISGDRGANATIEARLFPLGHPPASGDRSVYLCGFFDGGQIRLVDPAGPQISIETIASTGVGVHAQKWYGLHMDLDIAKALRDGGHGVTGPITREGTWRAEASLGYTF